MFVRQINSRLSRNAGNIDEVVLDSVSDLKLDLQSGLSIASLLTLEELCTKEEPLSAQITTPEILRDLAVLTKALAAGLADLHKNYEQAQQDSFKLEHVLRNSIASLERNNEDLRDQLLEQAERNENLEHQLKVSQETFQKRIQKAREHLVDAGIFCAGNDDGENICPNSAEYSHHTTLSHNDPTRKSTSGGRSHLREGAVFAERMTRQPSPLIAFITADPRQSKQADVDCGDYYGRRPVPQRRAPPRSASQDAGRRRFHSHMQLKPAASGTAATPQKKSM